MVVLGPGPQFKGGIANFTVSLSKAFDSLGADVHLISWKRQYPAIIPRDFIDRSSKADLLAGTSVKVKVIPDYNNPLSWFRTADAIAAIQPDLLVIQWAIAIQGLPLGVICRRLKRNKPQIKIIIDVHNVVQKETGKLDKFLTRYGLLGADEFIFHGKLTREEFSNFLPEIKLVSSGPKTGTNERRFYDLFHPMYDMFTSQDTFDIAAEKKALGLRKNVFLFFGFIRKYKGLHLAIEAFSRIAQKHPDASLLVVGESFWNKSKEKSLPVRMQSALFRFIKSILIRNASDESSYDPLALIERFKLEDRVVVVNRFIPNEEVHKWFLLSDAVVLFYEYATPSGVESLAYHYARPVLATAVGHFAYAIEEGKNGYLAEPDNIESMAAVMEKFLAAPISAASVRDYTASLTWDQYAAAILKGL